MDIGGNMEAVMAVFTGRVWEQRRMAGCANK